MPPRRVGLLGAGGDAGRLVAAELAARGIDTKADDRHPVDVSDRRSLLAFVDGVDVVINTLGPLMPVAASAVEAGVAYVDTCSEPPFLTDVHRAFRQAQVPVVPGCGFDCLPGDLAAAVAAEHLGGSCSTVEVHHDGGPAVPTSGEQWEVRFPDGVKWVAEAQHGERVLVPRHVPGAKVTVTTTVPKRGAAIRRLVGTRVPMLDRGRFSVLVIATGETGDRSVVAVLGSGIAGITARLVVTASQAVAGQGAMAPAEALEPEAFLDAVRGRDDRGELEWAFAFPEGSIAAE